MAIPAEKPENEPGTERGVRMPYPYDILERTREDNECLRVEVERLTAQVADLRSELAETKQELSECRSLLHRFTLRPN